jgi:hypothetical protein
MNTFQYITASTSKRSVDEVGVLADTKVTAVSPRHVQQLVQLNDGNCLSEHLAVFFWAQYYPSQVRMS